ncbi:hypothetical protein E2C01_010829 [Portunus trituberculatus]|uniref:Uncharacterized protein n=1 Tax=Portunus trituberculatus TaxID=210409 RepID=A0A5B7D9F8_PORTR|nr:hypothetical protein [Portunus trituberculatus]
MLGSPEERKEAHQRAREDRIFEPEIVGVHSHSREDDADTDTCSRCFTMPSGDQCCPQEPHGALHTEGGAERNPLEDEEEEGEDLEKENEKIEGIATEKNDLSKDDINSKLRFIFHLDGLKEAGGRRMSETRDSIKHSTSPLVKLTYPYQQQPPGTSITLHYLHQTPFSTAKFRLRAHITAQAHLECNLLEPGYHGDM